MDTVKMIKKIRPDHYSPAFYTPHPGSDLYDYCIENDLSLIKSHDSYRRNPTEAKIKGVDYEFLHWAMQESMTGQKRFRSLVKHRLKTLRHFFLLQPPVVKKMNIVSITNIRKSIYYIRNFGFNAFVIKVRNKIVSMLSGERQYQIWIKKNEPKEIDLEAQGHKGFEYEPKISIITPVFNTPKKS